jgi:cobalt-zinc-cadmium efflux system protein
MTAGDSHSHSHGAHDHGHGHGESRSKNQRRLAWTFVLVVVYMFAEIIGGWLANSLALMADAGHMLSDAASLAMSLFALWIANKPRTDERTFGYYRAEILAALVNGATLVAMSIYIFYEAFQRFGEPPQVQGPLMMGVAIGGLFINLAGLWILHGGTSDSLNVRGAWLHVLGDTLGSVGAIVAGALIWTVGWNWVDPVASIIIAVLILYSSWELLRETVAVLMESAPGHIDVDEVRGAIVECDGVEEVHDLHVWSITSGMVSLSAHVVVDDAAEYSACLKEIRQMLDDEYGIGHTTIQIEPSDYEHERLPI